MGPQDSDFLDVDVEELLEQGGVPGCSVAVLEGGDVVFSRGYGTSRAQTGEAVTTTTRMQACSMSKPVSVVAMLRLVEQGLLDLDEDVASYLTRWFLPANGDWRPRLTLRQLASHTAGLTAHAGYPGYLRGSAVPELVDVLSGVHPANAPGARVDMAPGVQFRYSGAGTTLLQLVMEEVTGTSADELLARLVLDPLHLGESTFTQDVDDAERAHGHLTGGRAVPGGWRLHPERCAAGLWTTPTDYLRLMAAVQDAWRGRANVLLRAESAQLLLGPVGALTEGPDMIGMTHVGLGFFLAVRRGTTRWFGHTGSNVGFVCASMAGVSTREGAVVMFNSDDGAGPARALLASIARSRRWPDVDLDPAERDRVLRVQPLPGTYVSPAGLTVELGEGRAGLELRVPGQDPVLLHAADPTSLTAVGLEARVVVDGGSITLRQGDHATTFRRSAPSGGP